MEALETCTKSGCIVSLILNWVLDGTEWSPSHSANFMSGERTPGTHSPRNCSQKPVLMSTEQRYALKDIIHYIVFLQDILHTCQVQRMESNGEGGGAGLLISVTYS